MALFLSCSEKCSERRRARSKLYAQSEHPRDLEMLLCLNRAGPCLPTTLTILAKGPRSLSKSEAVRDIPVQAGT